MGDLALRVGEHVVVCTVSRDGAAWVVRVGAREHRLELVPLEPGLAVVRWDGVSRIAHAAASGPRRYLHLDGVTVEWEIDAERPRPHRTGGTAAPGALLAPTPGLVTEVLVRPGEAVRAGQPLLIVEAMKMEHVVRAASTAVVREVRVRVGDQVEAGVVVAELGPAEGPSAP